MRILSSIALVLSLLLAGCMMPPDVETNLKKYPGILDDWQPSGLVDHFPDSLSPSATDVRFSAFPGFLQGGAWIQLRMELPADEIRKIYNDAEAQAKQYHDGGDSFTLVNARDDGLASTSFHTSDTDTPTFPHDYRIFILDAQPYKVGSGFDWNHGKSFGIAVSLQRSEVIYWAENW